MSAPTKIRTIVVLSFDLPTPEAAAEVLNAIDPPRLPHFAGEVRIAVDDAAVAVIEWLDGDDDSSERTCRLCGCTDDDCSGCIERTGHPCHWVETDLCSACGSTTMTSTR